MNKFILPFQVALIVVAFAESPAGNSLLDQLISRPGSYSQVCDVMSMPADIPYRAFELTDFAGASFSKTNQALMDKNRDALVKSIRARLLAVDFKREVDSPIEDLKPEENLDGDAFGCDPKSLNPLLLDLILRLHAIETLPELLIVEQKLVKGIAQAKNDPISPAPQVAGWFVGYSYSNSEKKTDAERDRFSQLFQARVAQRDLIMLMALLLREKSYASYLNTSIEAAYAKKLKKDAAGYPAYQVGAPLPEGAYGRNFVLDPIVQVLRLERDFVSIPYTRESRDEVRAAATKWLSEHP